MRECDEIWKWYREWNDITNFVLGEEVIDLCGIYVKRIINSSTC